MATKLTRRKRAKASAPLTEFEQLKRDLGRAAAEAILKRRQKLGARRTEAEHTGVSVRQRKRQARGLNHGQTKPRLANRAKRRKAASVAAKGADGQRDGGAQKYR